MIVLASGSPRRRELLTMLGISDFRILPAKGEEIVPEGVGPAETVMALARAKAQEVAACSEKDDVIIAADTIVWIDGEILGKPKTAGQAHQMLRLLSGRTHKVYTGVCVIRGDAEELESECTEVRFRELSDAEIDAYIATGEPMDKAGAYGAQGKAALFVEGIDGDFFNVMGLPLCRLGQMLGKQGVTLL